MNNPKNGLMPSLLVENHVNAETGELEPLLYMQGHPLIYRFNASTGIVAKGAKMDINLTKPGGVFEFIPIAYRIFEDDLFDMGRKRWAEFFFINESNQLCCIGVHGYSVDNMEALQSELYYEKVSLGDVILEMKPSEKMNGDNQKYYICDWDFKQVIKAVVETQNEMTKNVCLFRSQTYREEQADRQISFNYKNAVLAQIEENATSVQTEG